jgi:protein-S-isoprenylcysteine O-methyltransferase Ste14
VLGAVHRLFNHPELRRSLVRSRVLLGFAAAAVVIWKMEPARFWPGFAVSMSGEAIQLWCFASIDKSRTLAIHGPYAFVRNPMYLGRYFIPLGALLLLDQWWVLALFTLVYYFYMVNRVLREEARLRELIGPPYAEYLRTVNRFVPGRPPPGSAIAFWDWRLFRRNHGPANLAATLAFWLAAGIRAQAGAG